MPKLPGSLDEFKENIKITGGINATTSVYAVSKIQNRRPPFKFILSGSPRIQYGDWIIPIHFNFGTYQNKFSQEFNRLGIRPTYKNLTFHLGHSTVNFSPLALQGHNFLGAGVEWNPNNFRLGYIYGRFQRKIEPDSISFFQDNIIPSYNRTGMGIKAGYGNDKNYYDVVIFRGRDLQKSLDQINNWDIPNAAENAVLAFAVRQEFLEKFQFNGDLAFSAFTVNLDDPVWKPDQFALGRIPAVFLKNRTSTQYLKAIQTSLKYNAGEMKLPYTKGTKIVLNKTLFDFNYDRIDPGYQSMGTYFFRNDLERFRISSSFTALDEKLTLTVPLGFEHNNLFNDKASTNRRFIGGVNGKYKYDDNLNFTFTASNFRSRLFQEFTPGYDSLVVNQVDRNLNISTNYLYKNSGETNKITARFGIQTGKNITLNRPVTKISKTFLTGSYSFENKQYEVAIIPKLGLYYYRFTGFGNFQFVPSVSAAKSFLDNKLNSSYNFGLVLTKGLMSIRNQISANYKISDQQGVTLQLFLVNNISSVNPFTEFQMELRWFYNF